MLSRSSSRSSLSRVDDFGDAVWHADALARATGATVASGHAVLDAQLPGGGWPVGGLSEILQAQSGQHEWRLLLPALTQPDGRGRTHAPVVLVGEKEMVSLYRKYWRIEGMFQRLESVLHS